ncbi:MAG TPA: hypothetical protein VH562_02480 [Nitrosopumilaceae archaeon]
MSTFNYHINFFGNMITKKNVAIWIGILGIGIGSFLLYGYVADLMR